MFRADQEPARGRQAPGEKTVQSYRIVVPLKVPPRGDSYDPDHSPAPVRRSATEIRMRAGCIAPIQ